MRNSSAVIVFLCCLLQGQALADDAAVATVEAFHNGLIQMMRLDHFEQRHELAEALVDDHFSTETISRISLGSRHWRTLGDAPKADFAELMSELIATTYAARFERFNDQVFEVVKSEPISDDRHRVRCQLVTQSETVSLDYQLQEQDGVWRIYDVAANGVSDLSLKRSNYAKLHRDGGIEAVIADIEQEIAENTPAENTPVENTPVNGS